MFFQSTHSLLADAVNTREIAPHDPTSSLSTLGFRVTEPAEFVIFYFSRCLCIKQVMLNAEGERTKKISS